MSASGKYISKHGIKYDEFSNEIWGVTYAGPNEKTLEDFWMRLAEGCANVEEESKREEIKNKFYELVKDFNGMPGGRVAANIGIESRKGTTLFNCYTHGVKGLKYKDPDSINGIYDMLKAQALTLKSEGGYGINFSWLRPNGAYIVGIGARTPGPVKFMELWDKSSEIITMGSDAPTDGKKNKNEKKKIRKGAQMGVLDIWHPSIEEFIDAKLIPNRLTKFNMSVGITPGFMEAVLDDQDWNLVFPDTSIPEYKEKWDGDLAEWNSLGLPVITHKTMKARALWDKIMNATYTRNEPGVLFLDIANRLNPLAYGEVQRASNPCGEIIMADPGTCNLFTVNLTQYIKVTDGNVWFDYEEYAEKVSTAIRYADNVNDIANPPLPEYADVAKDKRRIGVGNMGLGSIHFMLGIRYGSPESVALTEKIWKIKCEAELLTSANLGKEKGSFVAFDAAQYFNTEWWNTLPIDAAVKAEIEAIGEMRNSHHSMNAPNGNLGITCNNVSGGIEPVFMKEYTRWTIVPEGEFESLRATGMTFPNPKVGEWFETDTFKISTRGTEEVLEGSFGGSDYMIDKNRGLVKATAVEDYGWRFAKKYYTPEQIAEFDAKGSFDTTDKLTVHDHVAVLKVIAKFTNQNSSKTVNLPSEYNFEDFKGLYMDAWKSGIKGITTYRAGTMTAVLEAKKEKDETTEQQKADIEETFENAEGVIAESVSLPSEGIAKHYTLKDKNKKKWYVFVNFADAKMTKPFAIFVSTNCAEGSEVTEEVVSSILELATKSGVPQQWIDDQIEKIKSQSNITKICRVLGLCLRHNVPLLEIVESLSAHNFPLSSFAFHITRLLKSFIPNGTVIESKKCPECGGQIVMQEGCTICLQCGNSKCG